MAPGIPLSGGAAGGAYTPPAQIGLLGSIAHDESDELVGLPNGWPVQSDKYGATMQLGSSAFGHALAGTAVLIAATPSKAARMAFVNIRLTYRELADCEPDDGFPLRTS